MLARLCPLNGLMVVEVIVEKWRTCHDQSWLLVFCSQLHGLASGSRVWGIKEWVACCYACHLEIAREHYFAGVCWFVWVCWTLPIVLVSGSVTFWGKSNPFEKSVMCVCCSMCVHVCLCVCLGALHKLANMFCNVCFSVFSFSSCRLWMLLTGECRLLLLCSSHRLAAESNISKRMPDDYQRTLLTGKAPSNGAWPWGFGDFMLGEPFGTPAGQHLLCSKHVFVVFLFHVVLSLTLFASIQGYIWSFVHHNEWPFHVIPS